MNISEMTTESLEVFKAQAEDELTKRYQERMNKAVEDVIYRLENEYPDIDIRTILSAVEIKLQAKDAEEEEEEDPLSRESMKRLLPSANHQIWETS